MRNLRTGWMAMALVLGLAGWAAGDVTFRVGEQETCSATGVTTVASDAKSGEGTITFDLSKVKELPKDAKVLKARLRMWVDLAGRLGGSFGINRWDSPGFDGFAVWQVSGADKPLAVSFPFAYATIVCHEWDVTPAVAAWVADASKNQGLKTNFPLPGNEFQPAWQRPCLEITTTAANANRPAQPTELKAVYRSGQVFLTWQQSPHTGAFFDSTYRVYLHTEPITAGNLGRAALLGEVHRLSQLNYRRSTYSHDGLGSYAGYQHLRSYVGVEKTKDMTEKAYQEAVQAAIPPRFNFVIDDAWPRKVELGKWLADAKLLGEGLRMLKGPELSDDTGLFVWTVAKEGKAFLAVASVLDGNENRDDFAPGNALAAPLEVKVEPIKPVPQAAFHRLDKAYPNQKRLMLEYAYWGGGDDGLHVEPSTPFFFRVNPPGEFVGFAKGGAIPPWTTVESWWSHGGSTVVVDSTYMPPTRLAPFPPVHVAFTSGGWKDAFKFYYGARKGPDGGFAGRTPGRNYCCYHDRMNTGLDPRQAVVRPYLENRALKELEMYFGQFPQASRDYVVSTGESNSLLLAVHHPEVFANCSAAQEEMWSSNSQAHQWVLAGKREWQLKNDRGENAWDWNDPVWLSRKFPRQVWPFIAICQSPNYARSDQTHWGNCGYPGFYLAMAADKRGGNWWWCDIGDAPNGGMSQVARNQAYLAFTNVNFCETPLVEWKKEPRGTLNAYLAWHRPEAPFALPKAARPASAPTTKPGAGPAPEAGLPLDLVDRPDRFEVAIRIGDRGLSLNGQSVPPTAARFGAADITPWRLQQFKIAKGGKYLWTNHKVATGQLLQAGLVEPDERGLITVAGFLVDHDPTGNKLIVEAGEGKTPPKVDESAPVGELPYPEYVKQCRNPVMAPVVKGPSTTFKLSEFVYVTGADADGSVTYKGGSFAKPYDTVVTIAEPGAYVITVRAKGVFGATWPLMSLDVGGVYGRHLETKAVDTPDLQPYRWYARLEAGKLPIRLNAFGDYYAQPMLPALSDKRLTLADLTLTKVPDDQAAKTATEILISPRAVEVPAGMPIGFHATVLNALGEPMPAPVKWAFRLADAGKMAGRPPAKMDDSGNFQADRPDEYVITAQAGELSGDAPIKVSDRFLADFNEGSGVLRGWSALDLADKQPGKWHPPTGGHSFLSSLWQHSPATKSLLVWEGGRDWSDCAIQADVFFAAARGAKFEFGKGRTVVHGLVLRAADAQNHVRLEVQRGDDGSQVRLVLRQNGADAVLAKSDEPPPLAAFDWQSNPICPGWHKVEPLRAEEAGWPQWRMDRMKLQAAGETLRAWVNGKEVFPEGVKTPAKLTGPAGLYCENVTVFDNVEVRAAKN